MQQTRVPPSDGRSSWVRLDEKQLFLLFADKKVFFKAMVRYLTMFLGGVVAELFTDVKDTSAMAHSVTDSDGVCFVPSFSGLQVLLCVQYGVSVFNSFKAAKVKSDFYLT